MTKLSFKTTTLIAAIGMSIAVTFIFIAQFIDTFTGIDLYVHPIRMRAMWRLDDAIWWASVIIFFWGMFRYTDQLPELNKWGKRIAFAIIGIVVFLYLDRLFYSSYSDPLWLKAIRYLLRFVTHGGYLAAMWWCYFKSSNRQVPAAIKYISLATVMVSCVALFYITSSTIVWWFNLLPLRYYLYNNMTVFYGIIYIAAAACALIGIYSLEAIPEVTDKEYRQLKCTTVVGWLLLASFLLEAALLSVVIMHPCMSDLLATIIVLFIFIMPVIAGIYLLIACRALQKAYNTIKEQHDTILLYQKLYPNAKQQVDKNVTHQNENTVPTENLTAL